MTQVALMSSPPSAANLVRAKEHEWSVELLRGMAAMGVLLSHYSHRWEIDIGLLSLAVTGVDLFFVISGFIFAPYLLGEARMDLRAFAIRRAFRIYPLYVLALATYVALRDARGGSIDHLGSHLLFLQTTQSFEVAYLYNGAFWTLPVEIEFYALVAILSRVRMRLGVLMLLAVGLIARAAVSLTLPEGHGTITTASILQFHLPGTLAEFAMGAWVWRVKGRLTTAGRTFILGAGLLSWIGLSLAVSATKADGEASGPINQVLAGAGGILVAGSYALVLLSMVGTKAPRWLMSCSTLIGSISYPLYLWHNAIPDLFPPLGRLADPWMSLVASAVIAMVGSFVVHRVAEAPLMAAGRSLALRR